MKNSGYILRISSQIFLSLMLILLTSALITAEAFEGGGRSRLFNVKDGLFSAELDSVPLSAVLENMKVISSVRYKADEDVLNERITVTFTNLSTEEALKRVLQRFNHVMLFDSGGVPVNIYIFGKKDNKARNTAIAGSVSTTQIRENPIQQRETRKISTFEKKSARQIVTSTSPPRAASEIENISIPNKSVSEEADKSPAPGSYR